MTPNHDIVLRPAYQTRDGEKFHDLGEAQEHTRTKKLEARYVRLLRDNPEFARVPKELFAELMRSVAVEAAAILTEPLDPVNTKGETVGRQAKAEHHDFQRREVTRPEPAVKPRSNEDILRELEAGPLSVGDATLEMGRVFPASPRAASKEPFYSGGFVAGHQPGNPTLKAATDQVDATEELPSVEFTRG